MANLLDAPVSGNPIQLSDLDAYIARHQAFLAKHCPNAFDLRMIAPAEATEVVDLTGDDLEWWAEFSNEDDVICDEDLRDDRAWDELHEAGRDNLYL